MTKTITSTGPIQRPSLPGFRRVYEGCPNNVVWSCSGDDQRQVTAALKAHRRVCLMSRRERPDPVEVRVEEGWVLTARIVNGVVISVVRHTDDTNRRTTYAYLPGA